MYKNDSNQISIYEFVQPFGGAMDSKNRWVIMADFVPWKEFEEKYAEKFSKETGANAKPFRMALGSLLVQQLLVTSDEETLEQIKENPYLQFFIGLYEYQRVAPFDSSMMTLFRKRIDGAMLNEINEEVYRRKCLKQEKADDTSNKSNSDDSTPAEHEAVETDKKSETQKNKGSLMLDATCAPADICYPTDLRLLSMARERVEKLVDKAHKPLSGKVKKPRTYRKKARKQALAVLKKRNHSIKQLRKAVGQQISHLNRGIRQYEQIMQHPEAAQPNKKESVQFATIGKFFGQQEQMYKERTHRVEDRIVSLDQPHVRPIVRGKASAKVEFGPKVEISLVDGFSFIDGISWDAKNESSTLQEATEKYRKLHGYYPQAILADQIYRNRENRKYCKERGIRLSGPALGRPKACELEEQLNRAKEDSAERNAIEGKFGEGKRKYGLSRIMTRLMETSESVIGVVFLAMNLKRLLRVLFAHFYFSLSFRQNPCFCPSNYPTS
jgi:hypothetical protein